MCACFGEDEVLVNSEVEIRLLGVGCHALLFVAFQ